MGIANYVQNGRRFGDRKMLTGAKIPKMSLQAYDNSHIAPRLKVNVFWHIVSRFVAVSYRLLSNDGLLCSDGA